MRQESQVGGVHVRNLFSWNSLTLRVPLGKGCCKRAAGAAAPAATAAAVELGNSTQLLSEVKLCEGAGEHEAGEAGKVGKAANTANTANTGETEVELATPCSHCISQDCGDTCGQDCGQYAYVDYVHIGAGSVLVKEGERVTQGQVLCRSGDVGFCPAPHLHIQVQVVLLSQLSLLERVYPVIDERCRRSLCWHFGRFDKVQ